MLKRIALIGNALSQINLTSAYNYDQTSSKTGRTIGSDDSWNHSFSPLIQVDGTLKKRPVKDG